MVGFLLGLFFVLLFLYLGVFFLVLVFKLLLYLIYYGVIIAVAVYAFTKLGIKKIFKKKDPVREFERKLENGEI